MANLTRLGSGVLVAAMLMAPGVAYAQPAPPNFACETDNLVIGAAEMSGLRVTCSVSGAPASDLTLRVVTDQPQPLCEATLTGGVAACGGTLITTGQPGKVTAELLPSGTQYQVLPPPADGGLSNPSLQYTPVPSDASPPGLDQPAPESGF